MRSGYFRNFTRLSGVALITLACTCAWPQSAELKPAVPLDPVEGILAAFKTHQVVALGEGDHNNEQGHAFRLSLIRA